MEDPFFQIMEDRKQEILVKALNHKRPNNRHPKVSVVGSPEAPGNSGGRGAGAVPGPGTKSPKAGLKCKSTPKETNQIATPHDLLARVWSHLENYMPLLTGSASEGSEGEADSDEDEPGGGFAARACCIKVHMIPAMEEGGRGPKPPGPTEGDPKLPEKAQEALPEEGPDLPSPQSQGVQFILKQTGEEAAAAAVPDDGLQVEAPCGEGEEEAKGEDARSFLFPEEEAPPGAPFGSCDGGAGGEDDDEGDGDEEFESVSAPDEGAHECTPPPSRTEEEEEQDGVWVVEDETSTTAPRDEGEAASQDAWVFV